MRMPFNFLLEVTNCIADIFFFTEKNVQNYELLRIFYFYSTILLYENNIGKKKRSHGLDDFEQKLS